MAKAVKCPVCNGRGTVVGDPNSTDSSEIACCGCGGKGWVEVSD